MPEIALQVNYRPLWKLLIDRDMKRVDLRKATGLSAATIAKLGRDENVTTGVLVRICQALECEIADIIKIDEPSKRYREGEHASEFDRR